MCRRIDLDLIADNAVAVDGALYGGYPGYDELVRGALVAQAGPAAAGRTDVPLTVAGERQAEALGRHLRAGGGAFAAVLTSPLARARETCRLAGYVAAAEVVDDLREWDYGDYEARTTAEVRTERPGWTVWIGPVPGGETVEAVGRRAGRVIDRAVAAAPGDVALFAHGHVLRVLAACWLGLPPATGRLLALGPAALSVLGHERDTRVVLVWNQDWRLVRDPGA